MGKLQFLKIPDLFFVADCVTILSDSPSSPHGWITCPQHHKGHPGASWLPQPMVRLGHPTGPGQWMETEVWRPGEPNAPSAPHLSPLPARRRVCTRGEFSFCLDPETQKTCGSWYQHKTGNTERWSLRWTGKRQWCGITCAWIPEESHSLCFLWLRIITGSCLVFTGVLKGLRLSLNVNST